MIPPSYEPLVAPARPRRQLWRTVLGLAIAIAIYVLWMVAMGAVLWAWQGGDVFSVQLGQISTGSDPWSLILLLSTFLGGWVGLCVTMHLLHRRRLRSLLGRAPLVLRDFVTGVVAMAVIGGGMTLAIAPWLPPLALTPDLGVWLTFLPLALLGILIQTGAEELVFRGYVQSQLAARFAQPLVYLIVPSLLFGMAHFNAEELGGLAWVVVASTALFGLIASDLTQRTGALGLAWGLHFANNVLAILVISVMGGLDGLALLHLPEGAAGEELLRPLLYSDMILMVAVWAACRLWVRRR
ncbi:CPBP family intramembrane glutamic endopeptidase [Pararhodobacter zhoushanensis]|uniref:CPBP family intramembrane glutamic endopeptidase n=1 Tax=Pararhodobacter zhoushanensis TaxID=2479545 RepID=UPI000F8C5FE6|nr:CPBP family intramembrane glutamic endopeptidase [Pararhodobacter zhoushanensis]